MVMALRRSPAAASWTPSVRIARSATEKRLRAASGRRMIRSQSAAKVAAAAQASIRSFTNSVISATVALTIATSAIAAPVAIRAPSRREGIAVEKANRVANGMAWPSAAAAMASAPRLRTLRHVWRSPNPRRAGKRTFRTGNGRMKTLARGAILAAIAASTAASRPARGHCAR